MKGIVVSMNATEPVCIIIKDYNTLSVTTVTN
jgi:hypothetical protein